VLIGSQQTATVSIGELEIPTALFVARATNSVDVEDEVVRIKHTASVNFMSGISPIDPTPDAVELFANNPTVRFAAEFSLLHYENKIKVHCEAVRSHEVAAPRTADDYWSAGQWRYVG